VVLSLGLMKRLLGLVILILITTVYIGFGNGDLVLLLFMSPIIIIGILLLFSPNLREEKNNKRIIMS